MKIKNPVKSLSIKKDVPDYPVFCFRYLQELSIKDCKNHTFFIEFIFRMKRLGELGWKEINKTHKHSFGTEKIPITKLKAKVLPSIITEDVNNLTVFRATGSNLPFLGLRVQNVFHVIFVETRFNDIYDH